MIFRGPAAWAEPREAQWEHDATHGLADTDLLTERLELADRAAEKHPLPARRDEAPELKEAA